MYFLERIYAVFILSFVWVHLYCVNVLIFVIPLYCYGIPCIYLRKANCVDFSNHSRNVSEVPSERHLCRPCIYLDFCILLKCGIHLLFVCLCGYYVWCIVFKLKCVWPSYVVGTLFSCMFCVDSIAMFGYLSFVCLCDF